MSYCRTTGNPNNKSSARYRGHINMGSPDAYDLVSKIDDRRERPDYGYDFLSHTSPKQQRYIEVKAVGKLLGGEGHRFFLSDNEHIVSKSDEHHGAYFFYLVFFDTTGKPFSLRPMRADELYQQSEMSPASYVVRFNFKRPYK